MACGPRRSATCNGSRSSYPRAACTFTASRTAFPACIRSAVTRCGRFASSGAITLERLMCSFPSAADQRVPSAFTDSSSASARPLRCHFRSTRTCCATPAASSSPMTATTRGRCSTISGTRTSSTRSDTPKWRPTGSRTFGEADLGLGHLGAAASGRRQARDDFRFPSNHLGICRCVALGDHLLDELDRALDLLRRHVLDRIAVLDFHLPRHQQGAYLHVGSGLRFPHFFNGLTSVQAKVI